MNFVEEIRKVKEEQADLKRTLRKLESSGDNLAVLAAKVKTAGGSANTVFRFNVLTVSFPATEGAALTITETSSQVLAGHIGGGIPEAGDNRLINLLPSGYYIFAGGVVETAP